VFGRPRYGLFGLVAFPFFLVFELCGPLVEALGPPIIVVAALTGELSLPFLISFLVLSVLMGVLLSVAALALEEFSFRRHARNPEAVRLLLFAVAENFGYRQLVDLWRLVAFGDIVRKKHSWGAQRRRGIGRTAPAGKA
jgi:hypothetical protein